MCTVMVIQQMPTNCVQADDDGPYIIPHINLCFSLIRVTHPHSFFFSLFFPLFPSSKTRNLSSNIYEKCHGAAPCTLFFIWLLLNSSLEPLLSYLATLLPIDESYLDEKLY